MTFTLIPEFAVTKVLVSFPSSSFDENEDQDEDQEDDEQNAHHHGPHDGRDIPTLFLQNHLFRTLLSPEARFTSGQTCPIYGITLKFIQTIFVAATGAVDVIETV